MQMTALWNPLSGNAAQVICPQSAFAIPKPLQGCLSPAKSVALAKAPQQYAALPCHQGNCRQGQGTQEWASLLWLTAWLQERPAVSVVNSSGISAEDMLKPERQCPLVQNYCCKGQVPEATPVDQCQLCYSIHAILLPQSKPVNICTYCSQLR